MRRGDVTRRTAAHTAARKCVGGTTGSRTTRSAALGRLDDPLAARRSLGVAGVGSEGAEPAVRRGEQDEARGCHRRTAAPTAACTCPGGTTGAHTLRRRRSVGSTIRPRHGARSASPVSALGEPSRRCEEESRRRHGDVTRRTAAHTAARTCADGTTGARTTRSAALGRLDDSLAARRSIGVAGFGSGRAKPVMRRGEQDEAR